MNGRLLIALVVVAGTLWLLAANHPLTSSALRFTVHDTDSSLDDPPSRNQVVLRTVPANDGGLGSVVAQLRSSVALSMILDASFSTIPVFSSHITLYQAASLLQIDRFEHPLPADTTICTVTEAGHYDRTMELIESWCDSATNATAMEEHAQEMRDFYSNCGLVIDDRPWDARYDMSKCTWPWVKRIFTKLGFRQRSTGIGLHVRWGDMSVSTPDNDPLTDYRSTPIDVGARLLRKLRKCGVHDELSVYMEWHNDTILRGLGESYRVVDNTGDAIGDLLDMASNKIMILDVGSYTVLAHQIAEAGLTIVPDTSEFGINWHDNGLNPVLRWNELLSIQCSELTAILNR